jgi:hypothetical protein
MSGATVISNEHVLTFPLLLVFIAVRRSTARPPSPEAKEALRVANRSTAAADVQHGASVDHDRELEEHDGDGGCDEDGE